jgi:hypothetical protein
LVVVYEASDGVVEGDAVCDDVGGWANIGCVAAA